MEVDNKVSYTLYILSIYRMASSPTEGVLYGNGPPQQTQQQPPPQPQGPPRCSYIDFVPQPTSMGGAFTAPTYPPFSSLLGPANQWLGSNPQQEVVTCESCEIKVERNAVVDNDKTFFFESGKIITYFIRILRFEKKCAPTRNSYA